MLAPCLSEASEDDLGRLLGDRRDSRVVEWDGEVHVDPDGRPIRLRSALDCGRCLRLASGFVRAPTALRRLLHSTRTRTSTRRGGRVSRDVGTLPRVQLAAA